MVFCNSGAGELLNAGRVRLHCHLNASELGNSVHHSSRNYASRERQRENLPLESECRVIPVESD